MSHGDASISYGDANVAGGPTPPFEGEGDPWLAAAPRAVCGSSDSADGEVSGLDGDVICNLEIIGQVDAPHFISTAFYKDCAYVNSTDGTTVVQVSADGTPTVTATLTQVGFQDAWESMKVSEASGLLVGCEGNGDVIAAADIATDWLRTRA